MKVKASIFRAYDIRGVYGVDLDEEVTRLVGLALGNFLSEGEVVAGHDVRLSSPSLHGAAISGLVEAGRKVLDIGHVTTPVFYFTIIDKKAAGGCQVTASHNPPGWNGLKLCAEGADPIGEGSGMEDIKEAVLSGRLEAPGGGEVVRYADAIDRYIEVSLSKISQVGGVNVAMDLSNGSAALVAPRLLAEAGCEVIALNAEPDGRFPAHLPEPTPEIMEPLRETVLRKGADFGACYDGDGDRSVFIDNEGRVLDGDAVAAVFAKYYLERSPGGKVVYDVSCSMALREVVLAAGGVPIESRVGHAFIKRMVTKERAIFGGERSGHFYFPELGGFDDGAFATLKLAEILSESGSKLSELIDALPKYVSAPLKVYTCPDEAKFEVVKKIAEKLEGSSYELVKVDGVKAIAEDGWFLIRPSNTMPQIKVAVEGKSESALKRLAEEADRLVREEIGKVK